MTKEIEIFEEDVVEQVITNERVVEAQQEESKPIDPWGGYKIHPAADKFPLIVGKEFDDLKQDIVLHGLRDKILIHNGCIIDGRNRLKACLELKFELEIEEWTGSGSVIDFIISKNIHRRHLDESQRAMIAADLQDLLKEEGKKNQSLAGKKELINLTKVNSRKEAAQKMQVSEGIVAAANKIKKYGIEELQQEVRQGSITVNAAVKIAELPEEEQYKAIDDKKSGRKLKKEEEPTKTDELSTLRNNVLLTLNEIKAFIKKQNELQVLKDSFDNLVGIRGILANAIESMEEEGILLWPELKPLKNIITHYVKRKGKKIRIEKGPIYFPNGGAGEYAKLALNLYTTCNHKCRYCYGPATLCKNREEFHNEVELKKDVLEELEKQCKKLARKKKEGINIPPIELCFACDPYQSIDDEPQVTRKALEIIKKHGLNFMILTKGGTRAVKDFELYGEGDSFGVTLTFLDAERSRLWEPEAALPEDRINALKKAYDMGIYTWISMEPTIDQEESFKLVEATYQFVDEYKIGPLNHVDDKRRPMNFEGLPEDEVTRVKAITPEDWKEYGFRMKDLMEKLGKNYYLKAKLRAYMYGTTEDEELKKDVRTVTEAA